ncbi:MAG: diaminopimelate epimerase, partial [Robiginitomaculum sp.]|nr:diaminopimelate epimerase [Robiginitomaculum sp.]
MSPFMTLSKRKYRQSARCIANLAQIVKTPYILDMRFLIMNGIGNRFGVLDARGHSGFVMNEDLAKSIASKDGVMGPLGADQIIIMREAKSPDAHVFMEIWNSAGFEVDACGNASRCIPWLLMEATGQNKIVLETNAGLLETTRKGPWQIAVDMGPPKLNWYEIPLSEYMDTHIVDVKVGPIDAPVLACPGAVSMGNPHCVFFVHDVQSLAVDKIGPMIEFHPLFPEQCNVGFAQINSRSEIRLRVWERGAGLTQACGTGACAALVAAHRQDKADRQADIIMDGGTLQIDWRESDDHVIMNGPV